MRTIRGHMHRMKISAMSHETKSSISCGCNPKEMCVFEERTWFDVWIHILPHSWKSIPYGWWWCGMVFGHVVWRLVMWYGDAYLRQIRGVRSVNVVIYHVMGEYCVAVSSCLSYNVGWCRMTSQGISRGISRYVWSAMQSMSSVCDNIEWHHETSKDTSDPLDKVQCVGHHRICQSSQTSI